MCHEIPLHQRSNSRITGIDDSIGAFDSLVFKNDLSLGDRIYRLGGAVMALKELEYLGQVREGGFCRNGLDFLPTPFYVATKKNTK